MGLVEVMISALLSCLLIMVLTRYFLAIEKMYHHQQSVLTALWDKQWVALFIRDRIERAGFTPCMGLDYLRGEHPPAVTVVTDKNGDKLKLSRMSDAFAEAGEMTDRFSLRLIRGQIRHVSALPPHTALLITDCAHAVIREKALGQVASSHHVQLKNALPTYLKAPMYVGGWLEESFYVAKNHHGESALFYQHIHPETLVLGVETFSVKVINAATKFLNVTVGLKEAPSWVIDAHVKTL